ncbi:MAG: hypothetical protein ACI86M_002278 [Saprospiraceae bacterium]|jgi:hypothetical protein
MKKSILFVVFSLFISTLSFSQWEKIAQIENDNLYHLFQLNNETTIATGEQTSIYDLQSLNPSVPITNLFPYGFITSSLSVNDTESYIGGGCYFAFDECPANTLHKTEDGGETWSPIYTDVTFLEIGNILGILPVNEDELVLVTEYYKLKKVNLITGDSSSIVIPNTEASNNFISGKASDSGKWLVAVQFYEQGIASTQYFESEDKGDSWIELDMLLSDEEKIIFLDYLPDNNLAAVSNKGNTYHSIDGNLELKGNIGDAYPQITSHYAINKNDWYISSFDGDSNQSRLHQSVDGGVTWTIDISFSNGFLGALSFTDRNNGFLIFNSREVYKKTGPNTTLNHEFSSFTISPNPANDILHIETDLEILEYSIDIIDAVGRKVKHFHSSNSQYNISNLASGFYQVLLIDTTGKIIGRKPFVKK